MPPREPMLDRRLLAAMAALFGGSIPVAAQCAETWLPSAGYPGTDIATDCGVMWDPDQSGPATPLLVLGGGFTIAGNVLANGVATWNPATAAWGTLGSGLVGEVFCMAAHQNGELWAAAYTQGPQTGARVYRWNGAVWSTVGGFFDGYLLSLTVLQNGDVVAGGDFTTVGGAAVSRLARWDGSTWQSFGSGPSGIVRSVVTAANGDLLVGGGFTQIDGFAANCIARWNGTTWSAMGTGVPQVGIDSVHAIAEAPNGDLYAGGFFPTAGGVLVNNVARWNGAAWSPLWSGVNTSPFFTGSVRSLRLLANGHLIVGGVFTSASGLTARSIARWTGAGWSAIGPGFQQLGIGNPAAVGAIVPLPNGDFVACGNFRSGGGQFGDGVSRWDGSVWRALGSGFNNLIVAVAGGSNGQYFAGGSFTTIGGAACNGIARWSGTAWNPLGSGTNGQVQAVLPLANGQLVVGGQFQVAGGVAANFIARWNGSAWSAVGGGTSTTVNALAELPGGDVVAAGAFLLAGGMPAQRIARWNGASWSPFGAGMNGNVHSVIVRPDGTLVASGAFSQAGTQNVNGIAAWNGSDWVGLGTPPGTRCLANAANGDLLAAGMSVGRWDGSVWTALGGVANGMVYALVPLPDGDVLAAGDFTTIGGVPVARIARWNGTAWTPFGAGLDARALGATMLVSGEVLLGGMFITAGGAPAPYFARLGTTCPASTAALANGCNSTGGANTLTVRQLPWLGGVFRTRSVGVPAVALVAGVTGFATATLPLATLLPAGQPGCTLAVRPDLLDFAVAAANTADLALAIPSTPSLVGQAFHHQHVPFEFDLGGALLAVTATNAVTLTIGAW